MMSRATAQPPSRNRRESASARVFSSVKSMMKKSGPGRTTALPCDSMARSPRPTSKAKPVAGQS